VTISPVALRRTGIHLIAVSMKWWISSNHVCYKFSITNFVSIQVFNGGDFGFGALVLRGMCTKTSDCHQQCQADSGIEAATMARRRLAPAAVVVVRWSKDLNVIFIMFGLSYTYFFTINTTYIH
jgi:hypothetical protein